MEKTTKAPAVKPAKQSSGLNPMYVIPVIAVIAVLVYIFIMGNDANFLPADAKGHRAPKEGNILGIIYSGGFIVPILLTFVLVVIVFSIERFITLGKAGGSGDLDTFVRKIRSLLDQNNIADAVKECDKQKGTVGNVAKTALQKYAQLQNETAFNKEQKLAALQKEIEESTSLELPMLEKNLTILSTLGSVSTLVALLGTVIGMIKAFQALGNNSGSPDAGALSQGIAEALINTALGIGTSAVAIMMYNYFTSSIDTLTFKIDEIGMSLQQNFSANN
jgi:biopolymer transport protein ExbB